MLKKRIISSSVAMALTASVAMLSGCPSPNTNPDPTATASASADPSASPSAEPTSTATTSPSAEPTSTATTSPSATPSNITPSSPTGQTPDIASKATVDGKVFDKKGFPVDGATLTLSLLDPNVKFDDGSTSLSTTTAQGAYVFRNVPVGTRMELKATKEGWTTQSRVESVKSNLQGDTGVNKFNFGSEGAKGIYALQDEPQVELVKVNGTTLDKFGSEYAGRPTDSTTAAVTSLKPELTFELMFTEAVKQSSVQNAFRVDSEGSVAGRVPNQFTLTESAFDWTWSSDGKMATVKARKPLLQENTGNQMRYRVYFNQAFEDNQGVSAELGSYFKFGTSTEKDYFTLALENDTVDPKLVRLDYNDTGVVDQVTLTFSESFDVHGLRVAEVLLFNSYEMKKNGTAFTTAPSKIELSSDGKSVRMEWSSNSTFVKDDVVSLAVLTDKLKDPAGRSFSTSDTGKVEGVDTSDNLKVFKVIN